MDWKFFCAFFHISLVADKVIIREKSAETGNFEFPAMFSLVLAIMDHFSRDKHHLWQNSELSNIFL